MRAIDKDRVWRKYKDIKEYVRNGMCTHSELQRPTESNVNKCMKEIKLSSRPAIELKKLGKELGEPTSIESFRPRR